MRNVLSLPLLRAFCASYRAPKAVSCCCRADRGAVLHAAVGKVDFPVEHLHQNLGALTAAVLAARPKGIKGGGELAIPPCVAHRAMHAYLWG